MGLKTHSWEMRTNRPDKVVDGLARRALDHHGSGIVILSGELCAFTSEVSQGLSTRCRSMSFLVLSAAGVLTERGEIEGESGVAALLTPSALSFHVTSKADRNFGLTLRDALQKSPGASSFVSLRGDENDEGWLPATYEGRQEPFPHLFGGGTLPGHDIVAISDGVIHAGGAGCAIIPARNIGRFRSSCACRLISPLRKVTRAQGPVLHELEGMLALDRLAEATRSLRDQPLVLLAVASGSDPLSPQGRTLALRAIQGVDPSRGSILFSDDLDIGSRVAFAVRDPHASRTDLEVQLKALRGQCAGTSPLFGIYVSCAGRGFGLYGTEDVDIKLIRKTFPNMPLLGMHSTFELAPLGGKTVPQIYTGVLGVFCQLS